MTERSEFDMSFSTLGRINYQLWHANESRRDGDYGGWWKSLENIYVEISTFLKDKDSDYQFERYEHCEQLYKQWAQYNTNYTNQPKGMKSNYTPPNVHRQWFMWEQELRKLMDKHGLLMKKAEDSYGATI